MELVRERERGVETLYQLPQSHHFHSSDLRRLYLSAALSDISHGPELRYLDSASR